MRMLVCGSDMKPEDWVQMCKKNKWNNVELRDGRYNQVIHMVSAAKGAEHFYDVQNHVSRTEGIELARHLDDLTAQVFDLPRFLIRSTMLERDVPYILGYKSKNLR